MRRLTLAQRRLGHPHLQVDWRTCHQLKDPMPLEWLRCNRICSSWWDRSCAMILSMLEGYGTDLPSSSVSVHILLEMRFLTSIIASDAGSVYEPYPVISLKWDPDGEAPQRPHPLQSGSSFPLGPHPADPHSSNLPSPDKLEFGNSPGPNMQYRQIPGQELWVYEGVAGYVTSLIPHWHT